MSNISKYFVALALSLTLVGCTVDDGGATAEPIMATVTSELGQLMTLVEGFPDESHESIASSEEVYSLTEDDHETEACWVVLQWCVHPVYGVPYCTYTGCTPSQAAYHCASLVNQYC